MNNIYPKVITISLFVVFSFISIEKLYSQDEDIKKNQIGLNILSYKFNCEIYPPSAYRLNYLNGITYKRNLKAYSIKISIDYVNFRENTPELFQGYDAAIFRTSYKGEETFKNLSLYFGFQKNYNLNKVQLYLGLDEIYTLTFYKVNFTSESSYQNSLNLNHYDRFLNNHWLGLSPIIGIKVKLLKGLSIEAESSYCIKYKIADKGTSKGITPDVFQYYINPLNQLSLNYEF